MAKVKINETEYETLENHLTTSYELLGEASQIWGDNFENLYNNFITNGFLEDLYKDAESQYYRLANAGYLCSYVIQDAGTGMAIGGLIGVIIPIPVIDDVVGAVVGAVIGAVVGLIRGITHCVKNPTEVKWRYDAKNVFEELLLRCVNGEDDNYTALYNNSVKQQHMMLALMNIKSKINEYQKEFADLKAAARNAGVQLNMASDDTTVLGIKSEVMINGEKIEFDASEAMAAFYTYTTTTMNALVAAELLADEYGYEPNYLDIVKSANSFMADTIESDLYTHEFITGVLPEYDVSESDAISKAVESLGIDPTDVASVLKDISGVTNLTIYPAIVGSMLLGDVGATIKESEEEKDTGGPSGAPGTSGPTYVTPGGIPGTTQKPEQDTDPEVDTEPEDEDEDEEVGNEIPIEEIEETELPEEVETEIEKDYDQMARDAYEFGEGAEAIAEFRSDLSFEVQDLYFSGSFDVLREKLAGYGYSAPEVEAILADPSMTINAVLDGETRLLIAEKAQELAALDGVENFESSYSEADYASLQENPIEMLQLASMDDSVCQLKENMDIALEEYEAAVEETNTILDTVNDSKANMEEIKQKYEAEFGEDTTKWSSEAVTEYNESIKEYNKVALDASTKMEELDSLKEKYYEANDAFIKGKENYYKKNAALVNASFNGSHEMTDPSIPVPDVGGAIDYTITEQQLLDQFMSNDGY